MEDLRCPFVSTLNPGTEAAHRQTSAWAERFGLVSSASIERQVATERFTWLVGRFYPWAQPHELQLISDFTSWLFWHDDLCDETLVGEDPTAMAGQFQHLLDVLTRRQPVRPDQPFDRAWADLRDRFEQHAPSWSWFLRFVHAVQHYFEACVWESVNRRQNAVPSPEVYMAMRGFAGGMYIYVDFVELVMRAELPLVARVHPQVARLARSAINVACWHNDLFSLKKELAYGDVHNLVVVLAREKTLEVPAARALAVDCCNQEVEAFAATARRMPIFGAEVDPLVDGYARGLGALMRGNYDWSLETERYTRAFGAPAKASSMNGVGGN
jgi:hypothetical protein